MTSPAPDASRSTSRPLALFFAITFGLTWGIAALLILFTEQLESIFGRVSYTNPLFILAVYSPGIAGVFIVWRTSGTAGLRAFFRRLTLWRMSAAWWAVLLLGIPLCFYLGAALKGNLGDPFPFSPWYTILPALVKALLIGPIEEFGWRGLALPLLQRRMTPIRAALVVGTIWGLWHIPAFMLSGTPQDSWSFPAFFIAVVAASVIVTAMFNASGGSLLVAALFHAQTNGPAWPDAQPWDTVTFAVFALAIVWVNRERMLAPGSGVVHVLEAGHAPELRPPHTSRHARTSTLH